MVKCNPVIFMIFILFQMWCYLHFNIVAGTYGTAGTCKVLLVLFLFSETTSPAKLGFSAPEHTSK